MFALIARTQQTTMLDGYIEYGAGDFDGQNSGHDFYGVSSPLLEAWPLIFFKNMQNGESCEDCLPRHNTGGRPMWACLQGLLVCRRDFQEFSGPCGVTLLRVSLGSERL